MNEHEEEGREAAMKTIEQFREHLFEFIVEMKEDEATITTTRVALMTLIKLINIPEVRDAVTTVAADHIVREIERHGDEIGYGTFVAINALLGIRAENGPNMAKEANA